MDKVSLVLTETFASEDEQQRKANLQQAVDQYLSLLLNQIPTS